MHPALCRRCNSAAAPRIHRQLAASGCGERLRLRWRPLASSPLRREGPSVIGRTVHRAGRSEEHTSELQSRLHLVCRLLLEKKKTNQYNVSQYDDDEYECCII